MAFPPVPSYPKALDTNYTLFLVHDTTETKLATDNVAWSQEINLVPVAADRPEIWAENGFGNINGELFYYDSVEVNDAGKVITLKDCSRQLGGTKTKFNKKGTWVRSYVVAEHHNQLIDAILKTEDFIGYNYDPRQKTLDWRIRNLEALEIIFDDFNCPDAVFQFNITEDNPVTGKFAHYYIQLSYVGAYTILLDFGDGTSTSELEGDHRYATNATVDPVLTISTDQCQVVITPVERLNPTLPPPIEEEVLQIPFPEIPDIPDFTLVPCEVPEPNVNLPPLVPPCLSVQQVSDITISGPGINMVSQVTITGPDINMPYDTITIVGEIPNVIVIDPPIPPTIVIDPPIPPTIIIVPPQSQIQFTLDAESIPRLEVDWGEMPPVEVQVNMGSQPVMTAQSIDGTGVNEFGPEFADIFEESSRMKVEYQQVGIPHQITVLPPKFSDIKLDTSSLPKKIAVEFQGIKLPDSIQIFGPDHPIPDIITIKADDVPRQIELIAKNIPDKILLVPTQPIPERILVEQIRPIPERIIVEADIPHTLMVEGIPDSISLKIPENVGIPLLIPEKMPEMELVYKGSPIEVKITLDEVLSKNTDGRNCVMITPCL